MFAFKDSMSVKGIIIYHMNNKYEYVDEIHVENL